MDIALPDLAATAALARALAAELAPGSVVALDGELGAGKTTFTRALVAALGGDPAAVQSPTYTLLHRYPATPPVVHIDAYRLRSAADLAGLGFEEQAEDAVAVIEWADRVIDALPADRLWRVRLSHPAAALDAEKPAGSVASDDEGGPRLARLTGPGGKRLRLDPVTRKLV